MLNYLLAFKKKQSRIFLEDGSRIPVTYIEAGPCYVTQVREINNHKQIQIGIGIVKNINKPEEGHIKKSGLKYKLRFLKSFFVDDINESVNIGNPIKVENIFNVKDQVTITGISKGKGFAGVVKRHGFRGGPRTHGQSDRERAPGSIGQTTTPGRVYKGKRMAGRMGNDRVSIKNLKIVNIDPDKNMLVVKGLIPGPVNGLLVIKKQIR